MFDELKELAKSLVLALFAVFCVATLIVNKIAPFALVVMVCAKLFYAGYPYGWLLTLLVPVGAWLVSLVQLGIVALFIED